MKQHLRENSRAAEWRRGGVSRVLFKQSVSKAALCAVVLATISTQAFAQTIGSGATVQATTLSTASGATAAFQGGTLQVNQSGTYNDNFTLQGSTTATIANTIDNDGHTGTFTGIFSDAVTGTPGPITITDSVGGGNSIFTGTSTYTGVTTINAGASLALTGTGSISTSSVVVDNGSFDISATNAGTSIVSLAGSGNVNLGAQPLTITSSNGDTYSGTISGSGSLTLTGGTEILTGANTYTGGTNVSGGILELGDGGTSGSITGNVVVGGSITFDRSDNITFPGTISGLGGLAQAGTGTLTLPAIETYTGATQVSAGTLLLSGSGSIATSGNVNVTGTLDISQTTSGASIVSLNGTGAVNLGSQNLTLTNASGTFSGVIAGSGGVILNGGTELLSGNNTYTGATIVNSGTLRVGASAVSYNVQDTGTFSFDSTSTIAMNGVVSGTGSLTQIGTGITTIYTPQTYTGATAVQAGTLALSGSGSISASNNVNVIGTFDISAVSGVAQISTLSGSGTVSLGTQTLALTNASSTFGGAITGSGSLTLAGGNETLSGSSTFTGATTIQSGTLFLTGANSLASSSKIIDNSVLDISGVASAVGTTTTSILSLTGNGSVALGGATLVLTAAGDSFSGAISGTGGLTVSGGTEILTGTNTYVGTTSISTGANLILGASGRLAPTSSIVDSGTFDISQLRAGSTVTVASLSGLGTVNLGSNNLNLGDASDIFAGAITGSGSFILSGGTEILIGTTSNTGATLINNGTLQIGIGGVTGALIPNGSVVDNAILAFDRSDSPVVSSSISGSGAVEQIGSGTTILTGTNSYTGGTTISSGTLQIGNGGTSGSITGNVSDAGTLAFARSDATSFGGTITGTGGVSLLSGMLSLTSANSYSGATAISSGATLALTGGAGISASSGLADNGTFTIAGTGSGASITSLSGSGTVLLGGQSLTITNASASFSGAISGTGGVVMQGGSETLAGTNTYSGATLINGGTLAVTGSLAPASNVTVNSGGTLAGTGSLSSVSVNTGGTIAPGVSGAGTLHVNGSVAFASGSDMLVNVTSSSAPTLNLSGAETLAGNLSVASANGDYPLGQKLTVLSASGGVNGTFTLIPLTSTGADLSSALSYDADDVYLQINLAKLSPLLPTGSNVNQTAPVGGIDSAIAAGDTLPTQFENLGNLTSAALQSDATQLAGEIGADVARAGNALFNPFMTAMFDHIVADIDNGPVTRTSPLEQRDQVWASGFDGTDIASGDTELGSHKFHANNLGAVGGGDWPVSANFILGAAVSAGASNFRIADNLGTGKDDAFQLGAYGYVQFASHIYGSFALAGDVDNISTNRVVTVSGNDDLTGKFNGYMFGGRYETGAQMGWIAPYIAVQDGFFDAPAYTETAASGSSTYALSYASQKTNNAGVELGFRQKAIFDLTRDWTLDLTDRLGWQHNLSPTEDAHASFAALPASGFSAYGALPGKDLALVSLGADLKNRFGLDFNVNLENATASNSHSFTGIAGVTVTW